MFRRAKVNNKFLLFIPFLFSLIYLPSATAEPSGSGGDYVPVAGIKGKLTTVGSDTLVFVTSNWIVKFKRFYPDVKFHMEAAGSSTAPKALVEGSANFGLMSRQMKSQEIEMFQRKYGYAPTEIRIALDGLALYVNKDNPVQGLSIQQVDAIFSATRKCGSNKNISNWGQVGLNGEWSKREIAAVGRNTVSGTNAYFAKHALCKGQYKRAVALKHTSGDVVSSVKSNLHTVGYSGIGFSNKQVKAVPLARSKGQPYIAPTQENVAQGKYPLSRYLYLYVNKAAGKPLPALEREFIKMVLSDHGQSVVAGQNFIPLNRTQRQQELAKIDM